MITVSVEGRALVPSNDLIGVEQDNTYETLRFLVPEIFPAGQTAYAVYQREDGSTGVYMLPADGAWPITSGLTRVPARLTVFLRVVAPPSDVWNSYAFTFRVRNNFDVTFGTVADDVDTLNAALTVMSGYAVRAETAETGAEAAQGAAETAQGKAEAARQGAQVAQGKAETARAGAEAAQAAASGSEQAAATSAAAAAQSAQAAVGSAAAADTSAQAAAGSAQEAGEAARALNAPEVTVSTLAPGAQAEAVWDVSGEKPVLALGIPQGQSGEGSGDMLASVYDLNGDGKVEQADHADSAGALDAESAIAQGQVTGLGAALAGKVDKEAGKGLSANDYTSAEKSKLAGIAENANKYEHPASGAEPGAYRRVTVDGQGHVTAGDNSTLPVTEGGTGGATADSARTNLGAAAKPVIKTATLTASGWTGSAAPYTQTLSVAGVPADQGAVVSIGYPSNVTKEQMEAWAAGMVLGTAHAAGSITFQAKGDKPEISLPVQVVIQG